jgi:hypothetical protein
VAVCFADRTKDELKYLLPLVSRIIPPMKRIVFESRDFVLSIMLLFNATYFEEQVKGYFNFNLSFVQQFINLYTSIFTCCDHCIERFLMVFIGCFIVYIYL